MSELLQMITLPVGVASSGRALEDPLVASSPVGERRRDGSRATSTVGADADDDLAQDAVRTRFRELSQDPALANLGSALLGTVNREWATPPSLRVTSSRGSSKAAGDSDARQGCLRLACWLHGDRILPRIARNFPARVQ